MGVGSAGTQTVDFAARAHVCVWTDTGTWEAGPSQHQRSSGLALLPFPEQAGSGFDKSCWASNFG